MVKIRYGMVTKIWVRPYYWLTCFKTNVEQNVHIYIMYSYILRCSCILEFFI